MKIYVVLLFTVLLVGCSTYQNQKLNGLEKSEAIDLSGKWLFRIGDDEKYSEPKLDEFGWVEIKVPSQWEKTRL
jgi:hypothetical protein